MAFSLTRLRSARGASAYVLIQQKNIEKLHQFVVLNHRLTSHIATLYYYQQSNLAVPASATTQKVISDIDEYLSESILILNGGTAKVAAPHEDSLLPLFEDVNLLMEKRASELNAGELETATKKELSELKSVVDQFCFIYKIAVDINKITKKLEIN